MHTRIPINFYLTTPNQSPQIETRILKHLIHPPKSQESKQLGCIKLEMAPITSSFTETRWLLDHNFLVARVCPYLMA
jgi:hypothetical protein